MYKRLCAHVCIPELNGGEVHTELLTGCSWRGWWVGLTGVVVGGTAFYFFTTIMLPLITN